MKNHWLNNKEPEFQPEPIHCEICGKLLGYTKDYDALSDCPGERASLSMGDYYDRREHYQFCHGMNTDEARSYAL